MIQKFKNFNRNNKKKIRSKFNHLKHKIQEMFKCENEKMFKKQFSLFDLLS